MASKRFNRLWFNRPGAFLGTVASSLQYIIRGTPTAVVKGVEYAIRVTSTPVVKAAEYAILTVGLVTRDVTYAIRATPTAVVAALEYCIASTQPGVQALVYAIRFTPSAVAASLQYYVLVPTSLVKVLEYVIYYTGGITKTLEYNIYKVILIHEPNLWKDQVVLASPTPIDNYPCEVVVTYQDMMAASLADVRFGDDYTGQMYAATRVAYDDMLAATFNVIIPTAGTTTFTVFYGNTTLVVQTDPVDATGAITGTLAGSGIANGTFLWRYARSTIA